MHNTAKICPYSPNRVFLFVARMLKKNLIRSLQADTPSTCIHMGLMKTGSTYLQTRIFPRLKGVHYVHGMESFYKGRNFTFGTFDPLIISNEGLSGNWYKDHSCGLDYFERFTTSIQNIHRIFKHPKIIVVFREPSRFIYSSYKQSLHEKGTKPWTEFFPYPDLDDDYLDQFRFSKFASYLISQCDEKNVLLLDFAQLKTDPHQFVDKIKKFCLPPSVYQQNLSVQLPVESRSNPAVSDSYEWVLIKGNKASAFTEKHLGFPLKVKVGRIELSINSIARYILPKTTSKSPVPYLSDLRKYYEEDWAKTVQLIRENEKVHG